MPRSRSLARGPKGEASRQGTRFLRGRTCVAVALPSSLKPAHYIRLRVSRDDVWVRRPPVGLSDGTARILSHRRSSPGGATSTGEGIILKAQLTHHTFRGRGPCVTTALMAFYYSVYRRVGMLLRRPGVDNDSGLNLRGSSRVSRRERRNVTRDLAFNFHAYRVPSRESGFCRQAAYHDFA